MNWRSFHGQIDTETKLQRVMFLVFSTKRRPTHCGIHNSTAGQGKERRTEQNAQKYKFSVCVFASFCSICRDRKDIVWDNFCFKIANFLYGSWRGYENQASISMQAGRYKRSLNAPQEKKFSMHRASLFPKFPSLAEVLNQ